ncbi:MAG: nitrilase-related carbon-nitrogen hydrolase, partial [Actinomycetota bacterium]
MVQIALGQLNLTVGDLDGNAARMAEWAVKAAGSSADVVVFPELAVTGYPPEDLVLRRSFVDDNLAALEALAQETAGACDVVVGFVDR